MFTNFKIDGDEERYLQACARIRNVSVRTLIRRLLEEITKSQMVEAILDDNGETMKRRKGEHAYSHKRKPLPEIERPIP